MNISDVRYIYKDEGMVGLFRYFCDFKLCRGGVWLGKLFSSRS